MLANAMSGSATRIKGRPCPGTDAGTPAAEALLWSQAPRVFSLNDDGYNEMPPTEVPLELEDEARLGAMNCPEGVIRISR